MTERKFSKNLGKPGMAAQLRETVSQVVRESSSYSKATLTEPIDFESFVLKNKTLLQNDPQRELLLYPPDDISQVVLPRRYRTVCHSVPSHINLKECSLFTRECVKTYTCNWHLIHYKYSAYSGSYLDLPKVSKSDELKDEVYEVDTDVDQVDEDPLTKGSGVTKQGFLLKGPDGGSDRMFVNLGHKSFKRRYCYLRREVDGTYILELHKDDKKGEAKATIVMDFCTEVVRNSKKGRYCFELRMSGTQKSYCLAAESETDLQDWLLKLNLIISQNRVQEERRSSSLERVSPPQSPCPIVYGTLKGLEQSVNPQLMKYARETESSIALARREQRKRLFSIYPFMSHSKGTSQSPANSPYLNDSQQEPYKEQFGVRILVKCEEVKFRLQAPISEDSTECTQVEPYFTTLALFDAKEGRKISEDFHFNVNSPEMQKLMEDICYEDEGGDGGDSNSCDNHVENGGGVPGRKWVFQCKQAVMSVSEPHSEIYLVLRIDKMLQGNVIQVAEPYIRSGKDPKLALKTYKSFRSTCQRIRKYRMPFAWSARPLFRLYSDELDTTSDFPALYRQDSARLKDEEILKILADYRKPDKLNKLTVIPGRATITLSPYRDPLDNSLTSDLLPLKPFPSPPSSPPTIEVAPLHPPECPHTVYRNTLYVYPESLAFESQKTFTRARNIACIVQLRDSDQENARPLKNIYSRFGALTHSACCAVLHHSPSPSWYDEIKILLPSRLSPSHHLLFIFRHISIEAAKKKEGGAETSVGYAWIPLISKGRINLDKQCIPVASHLPPGYLSVQPLGLGKGYAGPDITWVDAQKPLYTVSFTLNSTVFTRDTHLHNLFAHGERLLLEPRTPGSPVPTTSPPPDTETCKILKAAHAIQLSSVVQFLPTILNHVFRMLVRVCSASQDLSINIIRLLVHLVYLLHDAGRTDALATYAKFVFVGDIEGSTVHEELCAHLPALLKPNNTDFLLVNKFLPHSGFFFQIIVKSMAQYLLSTGRIKMLRNERFPQSYLTNVESLLNVLSPYLTSKHKDMPQEVQQLNASVAFFLKKCLSLMDRGFVFRLINSHMSHFAAESESRSIQELKFTFLQIVSSHEHFVSFNLPVWLNKSRQDCLSSHEHFVSFNLPVWLNKSRQDLSSEYSLSEDYCRQHFLTGLVLSEVRAALHQVLAIRRTGVLTLRDVLAKHEMDDRYQNKGQLARIAMLYLPWLGIAIDNLPRLTAGVTTNYKLNPLCSVDGSEVSLASSPQRLKSQESMNGSLSNRSSLVIKDAAYFAAIAGQGLLNGASSTVSLDSESLLLSSDNNSSVSMETAIQREDTTCTPNRHSRSVSGTQVVRCDKLLSSEVKDILMCFLFLVKHLAQDQLIAWWSNSPPSHVLSFFKLIELCLYEFKYMGKRHIASLGRGSSSTASGNTPSLAGKPPSKSMTLPARMQPPDFSVEPSHALLSGTNSVGRDNSVHLRDSESNLSAFHQALLEANLATEVGLICLDSLGLYSVHFKDSLLASGGDNATMRSVLELYLCFLRLGQSETLFRHVFASLRSFINHFSLALFQGNAVLCGRLCLELLRCCNSRLSVIRQESCAILYLLMRSNFEFSNRRGLTRVHLQVIISVSQLLGNIVGLNNARFQESLSLINSYATSDKVMKGTGFPLEVKDLTKRIRTVLMATAQMKELHHDPEVLSDLHHSLANSYASTPELRFTWLETMTRNHVKDLNYSEAAMCQLHIAALMAQYLKLKGVQSWGAEAFDKISSNIPRDETGLKLDSGVHEVHYTEQSLLDQLESCASYLEQSERYELLPHLYRLILPLYEARRNYEAQARCYQALTQACYHVVTTVRSGKRLLGRFYRVAFFGQEYFEEEHCVEFVYKEPKVTSLSEISERLLHQYTNKFGNNTVKIIMDSAPINANELDPKIAHIQVTSVTPHFDKIDLESCRTTEFEQNHDVATFMFETPFTKDGSNKPRAEPCDQWKRRTIITTEYSFPYVKKRLKVVSKREIELSPIEVALDEMNQRVAELADVVFTKPTDPKKLQLRLQGSVCVQVNAGPLAYATAFLDPARDGDREYPDEKIEELKDVFREFVRVCYAALQLNSQVVRADQTEYQAALRANFHKLCTDLSNLFQETLWPDTELGSFKRNSQALFSAISGANSNSSSA
ncbi:hypothetical protein M8J76_015984 [Diaphorina citri]|nr:hypothetical protein M8J76_015984 [Diaphorina citri]